MEVGLTAGIGIGDAINCISFDLKVVGSESLIKVASHLVMSSRE